MVINNFGGTMAQPSRSGKLWTKEEVKTLKDLARQKMSTRDIANKIHRSPEAVQKKARLEKISIVSLNKKPSSHKKK
jgi:hypothetical protein